MIEGFSPEVTVVIPTRDRHHLLARSLRTALMQHDVDFEVVIVDDGSSVEVTAAPVMDKLLRDPKVRVLRHDFPHGGAAARNSGLVVASAAWVAFLDDDDLWAPDKLFQQVNTVSRAGGGWSYTGVANLNEDLQVNWVDPAPEAEGIDVRLLQRYTVPGGGSSVLASAALLRRLGGFDESFPMFADWDMWIRLALSAPASPVDLPLVGYVHHPGSMSNNVRCVEADFAHIEAKYRDQRVSREVEMNLSNHHRYLAGLELHAGQRWQATKHFLRAAFPGSEFRSLGLAAISATWPGSTTSFAKHYDRYRRARTPATLIHAAERWLGELDPRISPI